MTKTYTGRRHTAPRAIQRIRPFHTPVRGHAFASPPPGFVRPGERSGAPSDLEGRAAALVREPGNPRDLYAVAVWVRTGGRAWRIGYLDRAVAARVAPRMDQGMAFRGRITGAVTEPDGRWARPLLLVEPVG